MVQGVEKRSRKSFGVDIWLTSSPHKCGKLPTRSPPPPVPGSAMPLTKKLCSTLPGKTILFTDHGEDGVGRTDCAGLPRNADAARQDCRAARAIRTYEAAVSREMLCVLAECGASVYGITDPGRVEARVATFFFSLQERAAQEVVERLAAAGIRTRDGHMYDPR